MQRRGCQHEMVMNCAYYNETCRRVCGKCLCVDASRSKSLGVALAVGWERLVGATRLQAGRIQQGPRLGVTAAWGPRGDWTAAVTQLPSATCAPRALAA